MTQTAKIFIVCIIILLTVSCSSLTNGQGGDNTNELTIMTHDSFSISEPVILEFESAYNTKVKFLAVGDTGTAVNKAVLSKDAPLADVFYGVDNAFLSRALDEEIFEPFESPMISNLPGQFLLDPSFHVTPIDYGDVCLNFDDTFFTENNLVPPKTLEELANPLYKGLLVVQNPATSSPGLAFLLTTIGYFGEDSYIDYWQTLVENDVLVVNDWNTTYYTEFSRYGGTRPIVVSYSSSPAFEIVFSEEPDKKLTTSALTANQTCFRQIEFAGILKGTKNRKLAENWIDFMLSTSFQEDLPMQMFVFPVNPDAKLDQVFQDYLAVDLTPVSISHQEISLNRERWIEAWAETVLR